MALTMKITINIPNQDFTRPEMMSALNLFQKNLFFTLHFSQNLQVQTQNGYSSTNSFLFNMFHFCNLYVVIFMQLYLILPQMSKSSKPKLSTSKLAEESLKVIRN